MYSVLQCFYVWQGCPAVKHKNCWVWLLPSVCTYVQRHTHTHTHINIHKYTWTLVVCYSCRFVTSIYLPAGGSSFSNNAPAHPEWSQKISVKLFLRFFYRTSEVAGTPNFLSSLFLVARSIGDGSNWTPLFTSGNPFVCLPLMSMFFK